MKRGPIRLTIAGETRTMREWALISGVHFNTIHQRLQRGIQASEAVFGERYSTHRLEGGQTPRRPRRTGGVSFPVGPLPQWGGVTSISWAAR